MRTLYTTAQSLKSPAKSPFFEGSFEGVCALQSSILGGASCSSPVLGTPQLSQTAGST